MRTTLDIDDDVLQAAKELARSEGLSDGQVISRLAWQALTMPSQHENYAHAGFSEESAMFMDVWPPLPNRQGVFVTTELVRSILDQLDLEDGEIKDFSIEGQMQDAAASGTEATSAAAAAETRTKTSATDAAGSGVSQASEPLAPKRAKGPGSVSGPASGKTTTGRQGSPG